MRKIKYAFLLLLVNSVALNSQGQNTIAFQGGGIDTDAMGVVSCWSYEVTQGQGTDCVTAGSVNLLPRSGNSALRVGGGCSSGCASGINCITGGGANACTVSSANSTTLTFAPINIAAYKDPKIEVWHRNHAAPCAQAGFDGWDYFKVNLAINGGNFLTVDELSGNNNYFWTYNFNPAGTIFNKMPNPLVIEPSPNAQTIRLQAENTANRYDEVVYIDDISLRFTVGKPISLNGSSSICVGQTVSMSVHPDVIADGNWEYQWQRNGINLPNETGETLSFTATYNDNNAKYRVVYSPKATADNGGCVLPPAPSEEITLTVFEPVAPVISSNSPVCIGYNLVLSSNLNGNYTYEWNGPNGFFSTEASPNLLITNTNQSGIYTLQVNSEEGCVFPLGSYNFTVNTLPNVWISSITEGSALINWNIQPGNTYSLKYRIVGANAWEIAASNINGASFMLSSLQFNSNYQVCVQSVQNPNADGCSCNTFTTLPSSMGNCPKPFNVYANVVDSTTMSLHWDIDTNVVVSSRVSFGYANTNPTVWAVVSIPAPTTNYILTNLVPGVDYRFGVRSVCATSSSTLSMLIPINTLNRQSIGQDELQSRLNYFQFYPNPARESFSVDYKGESTAEMSIWDTKGTQVGNITLIEGTQNIPTTHWAAGIYLCKIVNTQGEIYTQKIVIQK